MEITRKRIDRLGKTFSKSCNTFLESEFYIQLTVALLRLFLMKVWKTFPKVINKTYNFSMKE